MFHKTEISLRINNAFRAPNINDVSNLGLPTSVTRSRTLIFPRKSLNKELGIKTNQRHISASLFLYHNSLTNLMTNMKTTFQGQDSIDGVKVYTRENTGMAYIQGIEGEIQVRPLSCLTVNSYLVYTYGQNVSNKEPLRRIPPLNGLLGLHFHGMKNLEIVSEWQLASKQDRLSSGDTDDPRIPDGGTPAWNILNLRFSYQFHGININTGLINLFNEAYRTHGSGVDGVGRSIYISLKYSFTALKPISNGVSGS